MTTREMRAEARIAVTHRGQLNPGYGDWFPCMVLDMSNSGFLMVCNKPLPVGTTLDFRCELYPDRYLDCKIEVMHANDDGMGTMITEIEQKTADLYLSYLEERFIDRLGRHRKPRPSDD